jgi:hypothetical protein
VPRPRRRVGAASRPLAPGGRWGSAPPSGLRPGAASTHGPPSPVPCKADILPLLQALWSWRVERVGGGGAVAAGIAGTGQGQHGHEPMMRGGDG